MKFSDWRDRATLHHGDYRDTLALAEGKADLVLTSPPYCNARTYGAGGRADGASGVPGARGDVGGWDVGVAVRGQRSEAGRGDTGAVPVGARVLSPAWPIPIRVSLGDVAPLLREFHAYKGGGAVGEVWACVEGGRVVAGWVWTPPAPGAAAKYAPSCPASVLALSRMVAIPKADRAWQISKPLLWIMRHGLDRGRWPVLLTYSDKGAGHEGIAYMASRWKRGETTIAETYEDCDGRRRCRCVRGGQRVEGLTRTGTTEITAWTHRACPMGEEQAHMERHGWFRVRVPGKTWRSGADAYRWRREDPQQPRLFAC